MLHIRFHSVVIAFCLALALIPSAWAADCSAALTAKDKQALAALLEQYRSGWLAGDAAKVQAVFDAEAVLIPHHGDAPVVGKRAIIEYWWPADAPKTTIDSLEIAALETGGNGCLAYARGTDSVAWTSEPQGKPIERWRNHGTFLNVYRKQRDGSWKILQHMWDDPQNVRVE